MRRYFIRNKRGMQVGVLDFGAILTNIDVPLQTGNYHNVILSYSNIQDYKNDLFYLGATIGRYTNRINQGLFYLDNRVVQLSVNELSNSNHLHGGFSGFNKKEWNVISHSESSISLSYFSKDGEEGYPGNVLTTVTYKVEEENSLSIYFYAESDKPTILNLSNHCYFNLNDSKNSALEHELEVFTEDYTPLDNRHLPNSLEKSVQNTFFDLRKPVNVSHIMDKIGNTNYCFGNTNLGVLKDMARLTCSNNKRSLLIQSTYPGLQVYFGNYLSTPFTPYQGICLEPQFYPDSPNQSTFPSAYLGVGEQYHHQIKYSFKNF